MSGEEQIQDLIMGKRNAFFTTRERVISTQLSPDPNWFFLSSCIYWKLKWLSWLVVTSLILPDSLRDRKNRACKDRWAETKELFLRLFLNFLSRSFSGLRDWVVQTFNVLSAKDICRERKRGGPKIGGNFQNPGLLTRKTNWASFIQIVIITSLPLGTHKLRGDDRDISSRTFLAWKFHRSKRENEPGLKFRHVWDLNIPLSAGHSKKQLQKSLGARRSNETLDLNFSSSYLFMYGQPRYSLPVSVWYDFRRFGSFTTSHFSFSLSPSAQNERGSDFKRGPK